MRALMVYGLKPYKKSQNPSGTLSGDVALMILQQIGIERGEL